MEIETLKKGNQLLKLITEHEQALLCFEYDNNEYENDYRKDKGEDLLPPDIRSTDPKLIIEFNAFDDDWYRRTLPIPMVLSDYLVNIIKEQIRENLSKLKKEFNELL